MFTWQASSGAARLQVKPLRPCRFRPRLSINAGGAKSVLTGVKQNDGSVVFDLTAQQVATLRTDPNGFLNLRMGFTPIPQAPDNRWGYQYLISQGGAALSATYQNDGGERLRADAQGMLNSSLKIYGPGATVAAAVEIVVLS
jgi:hypothetical protein